MCFIFKVKSFVFPLISSLGRIRFRILPKSIFQKVLLALGLDNSTDSLWYVCIFSFNVEKNSGSLTNELLNVQ